MKKRRCYAGNRMMHCFWLTRSDTWVMFDVILDRMGTLNPATRKHWLSIAESRKLIPWMWQIHFVRLQFLEKRGGISTAQGHSGVRLANSTNRSVLMPELRKL